MTANQLRLRVAGSLAVVTPLGFATKLYAGPGHLWFNHYGGGVLYEVFWILVVFGLWPRPERVGRIPAGVLAATCALEVLQLWHPWFLQAIRCTFLGRTLIGSTFVWWDFPHYLLGCVLGWLWIRRLASRP